jgi:hypothetical protein
VKYRVTIANTSHVVVEAATRDEALELANDLLDDHSEHSEPTASAVFWCNIAEAGTGWEVTDVAEVTPVRKRRRAP